MIAVDERLAEARSALRDVLPAVARLVRNVSNPDAPAVGSWSAAEVAAHLSHVVAADTDAIAERPIPESEVSTAKVAELTAAMLADDPERDPAALADRITQLGAEFDDTVSGPLAPAVSWLGGAMLPPSAVACHLLEECLVHGHDIAAASGQRWPIARAHAALAIEGGALPIISSLPTSFVNQRRVGDFEARIDIRLRGGGRRHLVLEDGALRAEDASGPADAHLSADPASLLLVLLGRMPSWKPLVTGRAIVWGRRPRKLLQLFSRMSPP